MSSSRVTYAGECILTAPEQWRLNSRLPPFEYLVYRVSRTVPHVCHFVVIAKRPERRCVRVALGKQPRGIPFKRLCKRWPNVTWYKNSVVECQLFRDTMAEDSLKEVQQKHFEFGEIGEYFYRHTSAIGASEGEVLMEKQAMKQPTLPDLITSHRERMEKGCWVDRLSSSEEDSDSELDDKCM